MEDLDIFSPSEPVTYEEPNAPPGDARTRLRQAAVQLLSAVKRDAGVDAAWQELQDAMSGSLQGRPPLIFEEELGDLWDVELPKPTMGVRADGAHLLYESKIHWLAGEPGSGKTFLSLLWAFEQATAGNHVLYLDMESDAQTIAARLRALGIEREQLARIRYLRVRWEMSRLAEVVTAIVDRINELKPTLVVLDGMAATLGSLGMDENSNSDISRFTSTFLRPITDSGPSVVVVDHLAKPNGESKGGNRYARGGGAKLADTSGVAYLLTVSVPFSQQKPGIAKLIVGKDRNGAVGAPGETVAEVFYTPGEEGALTIEVKVPETGSASKRWIPDGSMGKVSRELEKAGTMTATELRAVVGAKQWDDPTSAGRKAVLLLEKHGFLSVEKQGTSRVYTHLMAFEKSDIERVKTAEYGPDPDNPDPVEEPF